MSAIQRNGLVSASREREAVVEVSPLQGSRTEAGLRLCLVNVGIHSTRTACEDNYLPTSPWAGDACSGVGLCLRLGGGGGS